MVLCGSLTQVSGCFALTLIYLFAPAALQFPESWASARLVPSFSSGRVAVVATFPNSAKELIWGLRAMLMLCTPFFKFVFCLVEFGVSSANIALPAYFDNAKGFVAFYSANGRLFNEGGRTCVLFVSCLTGFDPWAAPFQRNRADVAQGRRAGLGCRFFRQENRVVQERLIYHQRAPQPIAAVAVCLRCQRDQHTSGPVAREGPRFVV